MAGIRIKDIDIYHPDKRIGNEFFIQHFDDKGIDIRGLLATLGRETATASTARMRTPDNGF